MAIGVGDYGSAFWLAVMFGMRPPPGIYWVALLTGDCDEGFDGDIIADIEPKQVEDGPATSYYRRPVPSGIANWQDASGGFTANQLPISFGVPTSDWGEIKGWALMSEQTSGELYAFGEFDNPQYVALGNAMTIPQGGITITLTGTTNTIVV